jgi:hypothetical protein
MQKPETKTESASKIFLLIGFCGLIGFSGAFTCTMVGTMLLDYFSKHIQTFQLGLTVIGFTIGIFCAAKQFPGNR